MKKIISWIQNFFSDIFWFIKTVGVNPLEYKQDGIKRTPKEWRKEMDDLEEESKMFLKEVGKRLPHQWSFGETAWYESIRRREAGL